MSRIPKFESKLPFRKPQVDEITDLPIIPGRNKPTLRRSRSFDNLRDAPTGSTYSFSSTRKPLTNSCSLKNITKPIPSRLKFVKNQSVDQVPELPAIKKQTRMNLRRSKSFTDVREPRKESHLTSTSSTNKYVSKVNVKPIKNDKILKCGNTTTKVNAARLLNKPNIPKAGIKRTGDACESEIKNKVMKKSKVPDWDYKTRFCLLQEKHNTLMEEYKITENLLKDGKAVYESQISSLQQSEQNWREQVLNLTAQTEEWRKRSEDLQKTNQQISIELENLTRKFSVVQTKYEQYYEQKQILTKEKEDLLNEVFNGEKLRRKLHNCIQDLKGNIRVFCRLRPPLNEHEKINMCNFNFANENSIEISKMRSSIAPGANLKGTEPQEFTFDKVFNQDTTQAEIFEELSQLIQSAMDGYHVCVFAYGQTGSGKTYTMQGESDPIECLGMIPRSVQLIFARKEEMEKMGWSYTIQASFLEIYNETIRDLLNMNGGKALDIRYNEGKGTTVSNLTVMPISSAQDLMDYMYKSQQNRSTAVTNFNEHSSRSHAVTKIYIEARYRDSDDVYIGSVSLVDLAGSESAKSVSNARLAETKNINKSLSSLGNVMMALYKKESHIPYRNSKLTFLLQSSLGGNCKCLMIVNIPPINDSYNETINALRFAAKVKEVKIASSKNKLLVTPSK